jgi:TRAP-type C4-dicarboxylate transport system permease large subunit
MEEKTKDKKRSFINWVFTRWYYWVIVILLSYSNAIKDRGFAMFIGGLIGGFVTGTLIFMLIAYFFYRHKYKRKSSKK